LVIKMSSYRYWIRSITLSLLLGLVCACAETQVVKPSPGPFFVTSEITYLLDSPGDGGNVLGPLYRGDKVERVDGGDLAWWRVRLQRSGQTGWVRKELLSPEPVGTVFYYVNEEAMPLRECPRSDCLSLQLLFRGDQVQRVETGDGGWWRVLVISSRSLGWVRASALTEHLEATRQTQIQKPYYYVAVRKLMLRAAPSTRSGVIRTLQFNDQVQKLGQAKEWFKVRQPSSGALGWVRSHDLEALPMVVPRGVPAKHKLKPFKQREEPLVEPEFM
jgi:uncharacterized protein YgiM (DUF1202 family)